MMLLLDALHVRDDMGIDDCVNVQTSSTPSAPSAR